MPPAAIVGGSILGGAAIGAYASNKAAKSAAKGQQAAAEAQAQALADSQKLIAEANERAAAEIRAGNEAAAAATIEAAKIASQALLESTGMSIDAQREFFAKANAALQPTIKQGRFAADEMASMLSIPNSKGEMVPFDVSKLTEQPAFTTAMRAVDRTAVGKKISSQTAEAAAQRGVDFFNLRLGQLGSLAGLGAAAERSLAAAAGQAGANIGRTYLAQGQGLADIATNQGANLGNIYTGGANTLANLDTNTANALAALTTAAGQNQASLHANLGNIQANKYANYGNAIGSGLGQLGMLYGLGAFGNTGTNTSVPAFARYETVPTSTPYFGGSLSGYVL